MNFYLRAIGQARCTNARTDAAGEIGLGVVHFTSYTTLRRPRVKLHGIAPSVQPQDNEHEVCGLRQWMQMRFCVRTACSRSLALEISIQEPTVQGTCETTGLARSNECSRDPPQNSKVTSEYISWRDFERLDAGSRGHDFAGS